MALINIGDNKVTLMAGIGLPEITEQSVLFVTKLKEVAKLGDEITIAHVAFLQQGGWKVGTKANFSELEGWLNTLYQGNKTFFSRCKTWLKNTAGLLAEIRDKDDDSGTYAVLSLDKDADAAKLQADLDAAIVKAAKGGILLVEGKPKKAPKTTGSSGRGGSSNSNVITVSPETKLAEDTGLIEALKGMKEDTLKEFMPELLMLLGHIKSNPNKKVVKEQLVATTNKLNNGFTLGKVLSKAV